MFVKLLIKENGIFPDAASGQERQQELRARTALAYAYQHGHLKLSTYVGKDGDMNVTMLARQSVTEFPAEFVNCIIEMGLNEGRIMTTASGNLSAQMFHLLLCTDPKANVEYLLSEYFSVPYRWLSEHPSSEQVVADVFK